MKIMRRMLLRAGSAAALLGASAFSLAQPRPRLRLAIIGTGMRGQVLLQELIRRDDVDAHWRNSPRPADPLPGPAVKTATSSPTAACWIARAWTA